MIVFKSVQWSNFLSTGSSPSKVILNESPSTLVVGKNGEGKSTMLDALCFALFGKPFRNINKNQLINSINRKNCLVEIEFTVSGREYKVIRGIKPNRFEIWNNGVLINSDAALKDYQKVLEQQILKLNFKTFTQVVILGSSNFVPFMQLPSGQRREVIEDILDIRIFTLMNQILKEKASEVKDEITSLEHEIDVIKAKVESQKNLVATLVSAKDDLVLNLTKKIDNNTSAIATSEAKIAEYTQLISSIQTNIKDLSEINGQVTKANTLKSSVEAKIDSCQHDIHFFSENESCPTCTQQISTTHKSKVLKEAKQKLKDHELKLQLLETGLHKLQERLEKIQEYSNKITDLNIKVSTEHNAISILNEQNKETLEEIEEIKSDKSNIDEEKSKMKDLASNAMDKVKKKTALLQERKVQDIAALLLKDTGIKTAIIKEYLPAMNKLINKYLSAMDFYVSFELDEAFNEIIKSRHRDEFTYASFSEGEKMRIDLAILFTWRQIAKMKNSVNTNLLILDEVFDSSLDTTGTDYFLSIMNSFGENTNVFVISHKGDILIDKFQSVIKFEKRNDFSVMVST
jgi:DNA repair exonuclease SbcCD ATPase subunit